jgi:S-(hydroxymethyl)glutathione dehydrogenase/alcohol dehydrogenase
MAKELGADEVINGLAFDPIARIRSLTNGGVDAAFVLVGSEQAMQQALASVGLIGRVVLVGLGSQTLTVTPSQFPKKDDHHGSHGLFVV